jgi:hypothetical protein
MHGLCTPLTRLVPIPGRPRSGSVEARKKAAWTRLTSPEKTADRRPSPEGGERLDERDRGRRRQSRQWHLSCSR